jgi:tetratricopeptide (TPR) repeat protein
LPISCSRARVLADMTIPNGNVYYEVGIRNAAQKTGCVLLAAEWSKPLFDVAQMRTVRYPLSEGNVLLETAAAMREAIQDAIAARACGSSPMHEAIKGYPEHVDAASASTMKDYLRDLAELQGSIRAIRALPLSGRMAEARNLAKKCGTLPIRAPVAIALVRTLRESVNKPDDGSAILDFIAKLPKNLADEAEFREHRAFALSNAGQYVDAIAELETLIECFGPTPERLGLLGGRYRRLKDAAITDTERSRLRGLAIAAYQRGMDLDFNEYYCSSNLPRLYRERNYKDDGKRAQSVLNQVIMACELARERGASDEWLPATLLTSYGGIRRG